MLGAISLFIRYLSNIFLISKRYSLGLVLSFSPKHKLIILEVVEKKDTYKFDPKIAGFRNSFGGIDENTMSDEVIKNALEKNNNDFEKAFQFLFQDK